MSYVPTQPVGERQRFQSHLSVSGMRGRGEWLTPTRQGGSAPSPFQTALRRSTFLESGKNANPFTPRADRGMSPAGSRPLARRNTALSAAARGARSSLHQVELPGSGATTSFTPGTQLPLASVAAGEYPPLGGVGGWPSDSLAVTGAPADLTAPFAADGAFGGDPGSRSPFARPKSPAPRSASPRRNSKKLPSFLLGGPLASKPSGISTIYPPDTARSSIPTSSTLAFDIPSGLPSAQTPLSSRPVSPHVARRLSGFGSNDMLSGAYRSSSNAAASRAAAGTVSSLDDAPPVMTLDDMDADIADGFTRNEEGLDGAGVGAGADADLFALPAGSAGAGSRPQQGGAGEAASDDQDYNDVRIRAIVVSDLPAGTESSTVNYFRGFGEILAFSAVPAAADTLALLFSEPWQAQQAIAQGDGSGRILLGGRVLARVDWADAQCTSLLFQRVFPGCPLPRAAVPPPADSLTFAEALYAQSPRKRPAPQSLAGGRSRVDAMQESAAKRRAGVGSPFRPHKQLAARPGLAMAGAAMSTVMAPSDGLSASVLKTPAATRPRNGLIQSALDILFGW
ncbi:hypothetical protein LPJ61_004439 [Coemansia biformis]|uniref:Uncharacterized protein n=1 Tax=Coemansia biformis TaxID=1286918 RepID=A0A9W7Y9H7_9FUNG|nr:hypothetical protein LPJ61_004439 [Coemansia biformis]